MDKDKAVLIQFWLKKARDDLRSAQVLAASDLPGTAIYHCQQAAEKALKAVWVLYDKDPGGTHNINTLVQGVSEFHPDFKTTLKSAGYL